MASPSLLLSSLLWARLLLWHGASPSASTSCFVGWKRRQKGGREEEERVEVERRASRELREEREQKSSRNGDVGEDGAHGELARGDGRLVVRIAVVVADVRDRGELDDEADAQAAHGGHRHLRIG